MNLSTIYEDNLKNKNITKQPSYKLKMNPVVRIDSFK